jgi:hypothetical protein
MTGIQFVTDAKGRKTGVPIDLKKHGAIGRISGMASWPNHAVRRKASPTSSTGRVASSVLVRVARFSLDIKASAQKEPDALDHALFTRIDRKIMALADNPRAAQCKKLRGYKDHGASAWAITASSTCWMTARRL